MFLDSICLKNFRCFSKKIVDFGKPIVVIEGANGSGKTSLLEALHYACYLRSFRTRATKDLVKFGESAFVSDLKVFNAGVLANIFSAYSYSGGVGASSSETSSSETSSSETSSRSAGSGSVRVIKLDGKKVSSHRQLLEVYRVLTVTDDDIALVRGYPASRRIFLDHLLILSDIEYGNLLKRYNGVLAQRNALLVSFARKAKKLDKVDKDSYDLWTSQLVTLASKIREKRKILLNEIESIVNFLLENFFGVKAGISLKYLEKKVNFSSESGDTCSGDTCFLKREIIFRRSLLGAHLDDFEIVFEEKSSKSYSSRGQQRLVAILLKIAYYLPVNNFVTSGTSRECIFLLDDIFSELDDTRLFQLFSILDSCESQFIITSPKNSFFTALGNSSEYKKISI